MSANKKMFSTPENATAAKLIVQGFSYNGHQMKAFFAQVETYFEF